MVDGQQPSLEEQGEGAISDHARAWSHRPTTLHAIAAFSGRIAFFSSQALRRFALEKAPAPGLPLGETASEQRGRRFFEDVGPDFAQGLKRASRRTATADGS